MREADPGVDKVMDRLHTLEALVKELRGQLEQAATHSASGDSSEVHSPESSTQHHDADHHIEVSSTNETSLHKQFGRMVLQDASRSRYVSSGFWSRVDDEVCGLLNCLLAVHSADVFAARWPEDGCRRSRRGRQR